MIRPEMDAESPPRKVDSTKTKNQPAITNAGRACANKNRMTAPAAATSRTATPPVQTAPRQRQMTASRALRLRTEAARPPPSRQGRPMQRQDEGSLPRRKSRPKPAHRIRDTHGRNRPGPHRTSTALRHGRRQRTRQQPSSRQPQPFSFALSRRFRACPVL